MDAIRTYLLSVVAAAIIAAIVIGLIGSKSPYYGVIRLLTGIFLSITVVSPLVKIKLTDISTYFSDFTFNSAAVVHDGTESAYAAMSEIIKENTEAYILDKAASMGLTIDVTVYLTESSPPVPISVTIVGPAAPYAKMQLQEIIESDLAIPKENQCWT